MDEKDISKEGLPIVRETAQLLEYYETVYRQIPNASKHGVIVPSLNGALRELFVLLVSTSKLYPKKQILTKADIMLECIKHYIRILDKDKLISSTQYEQLSKHTVSIGRQLGGWLGSLKEK